MSFSNDNELLSGYYGLIARGNRFFLSHYSNVNDRSHTLYEITQSEATRIQIDFERCGWTETFVDDWIIPRVV